MQKEEPHFDASINIRKLCETDQMSGFVSALTFPNPAYMIQKELTPERIIDKLKSLRCFSILRTLAFRI